MPEDVVLGSSVIRLLMNTNLFHMFFPEIIDEYGMNKGVDVKCGFSKDYLSGGHLEHNQISQIYLKDSDTIDFNIHFGCGIYVHTT